VRRSVLVCRMERVRPSGSGRIARIVGEWIGAPVRQRTVTVIVTDTFEGA